MSVDIKTIVLEKIRIGKHFSLQSEEYTDISKNVQLLANVRFSDGDTIRENFFANTSKNRKRNFLYYNRIS